MITPGKNRPVTAGILLTLLALSGCGESNRVELIQVEGTVLQQSQPLADAWVEFIPEFDARTAVGRTDEAGKFVLNYVGDQNGARPGTYHVKIGTGGKLDPKDPRGITGIPRAQVFEQKGVTVTPESHQFEFQVTSK